MKKIVVEIRVENAAETFAALAAAHGGFAATALRDLLVDREYPTTTRALVTLAMDANDAADRRHEVEGSGYGPADIKFDHTGTLEYGGGRSRVRLVRGDGYYSRVVQVSAPTDAPDAIADRLAVLDRDQTIGHSDGVVSILYDEDGTMDPVNITTRREVVTVGMVLDWLYALEGVDFE